MSPDGRGRIVVLDYGIGNLRSAEKGLQHVDADARLATDPRDVAGAAGVVLPGVGAFGPCMAALRRTGLADAALGAIHAGVPFLGICVGLQMLCTESAETPGAAGLGVIDATVVPLPEGVKHPQMQWNKLVARSGPGQESGSRSRMLAGIPDGSWMYFVHSFAPEITGETVAVCDYGGTVCAAVERGVVWGTQFHPEKSGRPGLAILANFRDLVEEQGTSVPRAS